MRALALTVERKNKIHARAAREATRHFSALANTRGECDDCHCPDLPLIREDSDEGWQSCETCTGARAGRRAVRAAEKAVRS